MNSLVQLLAVLLFLTSPAAQAAAQADETTASSTAGASAVTPSATQSLPQVTSPLSSPREYALHKMRLAGFSEAFIARVLKSHDETTTEHIVELNVLGFLHKADYSGHFSQRAVRKCNEFMKKYRTQLKRAKALYSVEPEAIAALLWVETKHGKMTGHFPVSSVYFSLLQADHPLLIESSSKALAEKTPVVTPEYTAKLKERSHLKAEWAMEEMKALELIYRKDSRKNQIIKGSFAGAFGNSQFIPSSYRSWAKSARANAPANLFSMNDSIHSVASYLHSNGWKLDDTEAKRQALFHYNRAQGYVDVILKLASCVDKKGLIRVTASDAVGSSPCSS
ncbi:MAG: lytic murein transglycosylase [Methylotenera sp.]|nr:lytic murein transglycosylase [Oligoflexia bacterium]